MSQEHIQFRHENGKVIFVFNGKGYSMPWEKADDLSRAAATMARQAEEYCKANQIIADNALMQRSGFPMGLSDNPIIQDETIKEALGSKYLRRVLPWRDKNTSSGIGGIKTRGAVGAPTLSKRAAT